MSLMGEYQFTLDAKGRVSLPAKFRKVMPDDLVVTLGLDNGVLVFTDEEFQSYRDSFFCDEINGACRYDQSDENDRRLRRKISKLSADTSVDSAGRITIPASIRELAGMDKDVVVLGDDNGVSIWNPARLEEFLDGVSVGGELNDLVAGRKQRIATQRSEG